MEGWDLDGDPRDPDADHFVLGPDDPVSPGAAVVPDDPVDPGAAAVPGSPDGTPATPDPTVTPDAAAVPGSPDPTVTPDASASPVVPGKPDARRSWGQYAGQKTRQAAKLGAYGALGLGAYQALWNMGQPNQTPMGPMPPSMDPAMQDPSAGGMPGGMVAYPTPGDGIPGIPPQLLTPEGRIRDLQRVLGRISLDPNTQIPSNWRD